jgi:uncharacterized protein with NRDE domain
MCLIILAHRVHPGYPLLLAANRDEYYRRPTQPARFWEQQPQLLAGRDLEAGGTWMGVTRDGRFAAVTNYRDPSRTAPAPRSRGELPLAWLASDVPGRAEDCLAQIAGRGAQYAGFNLLLGDAGGLWYCSNVGAAGVRRLAPGFYGLSNASLDTPWPKVLLGKARMQALLGVPADHAQLRRAVQDRELARPEDLHPLGLREAMDQLLSAQFIHAGAYGTRSTTTLWWRTDGLLSWREHSYGADGAETGVMQEDFAVTGA